jgi:predicted Kef-type K+ transport protein
MVLVLVLIPAFAGLMGGRTLDQAHQAPEGMLLAWLEPRTIWAALGITLGRVDGLG